VLKVFFFEASTVGETPTAPKILLYKEKNVQDNYRIFTNKKGVYGRFSIHDNKV
jgi:hypothetical protein